MPLEFSPLRRPDGSLELYRGRPGDEDGGGGEEEAEVLALQENAVRLVLQSHNYGLGTLYVTSRRLVWLSSRHPSTGGEDERHLITMNGGVSEGRRAADHEEASACPRDISIDYPSIVLHAISRDPSSGEAPCIYCQLKSDPVEEERDEDYLIPELKLFPSNPEGEKLDRMFKVIAEMAALNPDLDAQQDADDDDEEFFTQGNLPPSGWEFVSQSDQQQQQQAGEEEERIEERSQNEGMDGRQQQEQAGQGNFALYSNSTRPSETVEERQEERRRGGGDREGMDVDSSSSSSH
ncbi:nucleotide-sensitive chloride conductance regulator protein [Cystoisospora suis]|uniref:Nucleotide-sensitive chloride conductance regulator protein n=1 Tax=Cystoisospora suis TaxID=483139 RepID=A0A2C6KPJ4_9APIC|nr:nucleotide-sensitive chloride conductance regulator protein [Cystoisospora suis]